MMGAPCARYLAEAGAAVALVAAPEPLVKARAQGPFGSHYDTARITRRLASDPDWAQLSGRSIARYAEIEARSEQRIYREVGALMAGPEEGAMAPFMSRVHAVAEGLAPVPDALGTCAVWERLGFALPCGSDARFEARHAGWIDPRAMRDAQIALAQDAGARVLPQAVVARDGGRVTLADGSEIEGAQVVVATGPHAGSDGLLPRSPNMTVWARTIAFARLSDRGRCRGSGSRCPRSSSCRKGGTTTSMSCPPVRYPDGHLYLKIGGQTEQPPHNIGPQSRCATGIHGCWRCDGRGRPIAARNCSGLLPGIRHSRPPIRNPAPWSGPRPVFPTSSAWTRS